MPCSRNVLTLSLLAFSLGACAAPGTQRNGITPELGQTLLTEETRRARGLDTSVSEQSIAQYYFIRGQLALNDENFDEAVTDLEEAGRHEKGDAPVLRKSLAEMYLRSGRLQDALNELNKIADVGRSDSEFLELRAGILATLKRLPDAIADYRTLINLTPDKANEDAYVLLASLHADNGDLNAAKEVLRELIGRSPKSVFGHYYLARVTEASGDSKEAEKLYRKALKLNPNAEAIKLDLARSLGAQKRFREGAAISEELVRHNPNNVAARQLLGQLLLGDNRVEEALTAFESLGKLQNDPTDTRFKIALIKLERRDFKGAETELNLIVASAPENEAAHYYLALAYSGMERIGEALTQLEKVSDGSKLFTEARILSSYLLRQQKRYDDAILEIQRALSKNDKDTRLLSFLGSLQRDAGKTKEAVLTLRRLIELEPNDDQHYFSLGVFLDDVGDKQAAVEAMRKAIELNPKNANALNYLGYTFAETGSNLGEAEALIRRAIAVEPKNGYFVDSLGWVYFKMNRLQDAERELEKAVTMTPSDAVILEHLAIIQNKQGKREKSLETAKKALGVAPNSDDKEVTERLQALIHELTQPLP